MMRSVDWNLMLGAVTALATGCLAVVAVLALIAARAQITTSKRIAAVQLFNEVFKLEIANKSLADGTKTLQESKCLAKNEQYPSFMAFMLTSYEQIIETEFGQHYYNGWRESIKFNLKYHLGYFVDESGNFASDRFITFYDDRLVEIIQEIVKEANNA